MTNEEREAIKILKEIQESNRAWLMQTKEENCEKIYLKDIEAIDTVLSLIKEQEAEMEDLKNKSVLIKRYFKKCDLIKQKDKQIDLMAERIEWLCKSNGILLDKEHDENSTQEDVKQYFERKVKDVKD